MARPEALVLRWAALLVLAFSPLLTVAGPSAVTRLKADTPRTTVQGTRFTAPMGWAMRAWGNVIVLEAPEGDSRIALVDVPGGDADAAVAAAWAASAQGAAPDLKNASDRPPRNGWAQVRSYRYRTPGGARRTVYATALRDGERWAGPPQR